MRVLTGSVSNNKRVCQYTYIFADCQRINIECLKRVESIPFFFLECFEKKVVKILVEPFEENLERVNNVDVLSHIPPPFRGRNRVRSLGIYHKSGAFPE